MTVRLHRDYETRSTVNIKTCGAYVYAEHPTTEPMCMAYAVDDSPIKLWLPGHPCPPEFIECARNPDWLAVAHNDNFETLVESRIMSRRYGWPEIPIKRHRCTMTQAFAMALPGSLENMASALGMSERKDMDGRKTMLKVSKPRKINADGSVIWWDHPELLKVLYSYCMNDVAVEREGDKRLLELSATEQRLWELDQEINERGIYIDLPAVHRAIELVENEKTRLNAEMQRVTDGAVPTCNAVAKIIEWASRVHGYDLTGAAKADVKDALESDNLPDPVRQCLELRKEGAKASVAKLKAMVAGVSSDGRVRGTMQFTVATTRRWAGRRIQPQNLPRIELLKKRDGDPDQDAINHILEMLGDEKWNTSPLD